MAVTGVINHRKFNCLCSTACYGLQQRKYQSSAICDHLSSQDSPHKWPVMGWAFPCHDIIMSSTVVSVLPNADAWRILRIRCRKNNPIWHIRVCNRILVHCSHRTGGQPPETHLKVKSREISFVHYLFLHCRIDLKFCTGHGSNTVVLCAKYQTDLTTGMGVMSKRVLGI